MEIRPILSDLSKKFKMERQEFIKQLRKKVQLRLNFNIDWDLIEKQITINTLAEWPMTPNIDIFTYREMGSDSVDDNERNKVFMNLYKNKNYNLIELEWNKVIEHSFGGWKEVLVQAKEVYLSGNFKIAIPLLFSYLEAFLVNHIPEKNTEVSKSLAKNFIEKYQKKTDFKLDLFLLKSNEILLTKVVYDRGYFGEKEPAFNRNCVLHGRHDPGQWREMDAIKLIAILSSLTFIKNIKEKFEKEQEKLKITD